MGTGTRKETFHVKQIIWWFPLHLWVRWWQ